MTARPDPGRTVRRSRPRVVRRQRLLRPGTGTLTLLRDDGFTVEEMIEWLFTPDPSLPGTPAQALAENRGTEVKRRAQALAV